MKTWITLNMISSIFEGLFRELYEWMGVYLINSLWVLFYNIFFTYFFSGKCINRWNFFLFPYFILVEIKYIYCLFVFYTFTNC